MAATERRRYLLDNLKKYRTLGELRSAPFFANCTSEIESLLATPEIIPCDTAAPRLSVFVRIAQWNLEKGKKLEAAVRMFETDNVLKWADVIILNEADRGMLRSGNRHVARDLASALGMNMAFAAAYLELTKGVDEERLLEGENGESLQGNAVLTRYPICSARVVRLPQCFEAYEHSEKRYGCRNCLWVRLGVGQRRLWVGSTHLEVRNTPRCRAAQMKCLVDALPGTGDEPHILGGDLNTNGFRRGNRWRTLSAAARLILSSPAAIDARLIHPERIEPLFRVAGRAGLSPQGLNSREATASAAIESGDEAGMLPLLVADFLRKRLARYQGYVQLKLDWLLGKGVRALHEHESFDAAACAVSADPGCRQTARRGPNRISDHSPIFADVRLP